MQEERMDRDELLKLLEELKLDREEFWVLSSSALVLRGIYPDAGDLDIAFTEKGLEELKKNYDVQKKGDGPLYRIADRIEGFVDEKEEWKIEKWGEYYLEDIKKYYDYLLMSDREKDKARIPIVEEYMKKRQG